VLASEAMLDRTRCSAHEKAPPVRGAFSQLEGNQSCYRQPLIAPLALLSAPAAVR
jgi:hypothetical protein